MINAKRIVKEFASLEQCEQRRTHGHTSQLCLSLRAQQGTLSLWWVVALNDLRLPYKDSATFNDDDEGERNQQART